MKCTPGPLVAQCSGSVGGQTFSRNKGGAYVRTRAIPTNPQTVRQSAARQSFTQCAGSWASLSPSQQQAWNDFAPTIVRTDPLGQTITLSGQQAYMLVCNPVNFYREEFGLSVPLPTNPPTNPTGSPTTVSPQPSNASVAGNNIEVEFEPTDPWANSDDGALVVMQGQPASSGKRPQDMPRRSVGVIQGSATTPPTSPQVFDSAWFLSPPVEGKDFVISSQTILSDVNIPGAPDLSDPIAVGP